MDAGEQIVVTGSRVVRSPFQYFLNLTFDGMAIVAAILVIALFVPALRRWFFRTPLVASLLALVATLRLAVEIPYAIAAGRYDAGMREPILGLDPLALLELIEAWSRPISLVALGLFAAGRVIAWIFGTASSATGSPDDITIPSRPWRWRFPLTFRSAWEFLTRRRSFVRDRDAIVQAISDPDFHPLGYRATGSLLAGIPAAATIAVLGYFFPREGTTLVTEAVTQTYGLIEGALRPFAITISFTVASVVAGWALTLARPSKSVIGRQSYLAIDGTRIFWPETYVILASSLSVFILSDEMRQAALTDWVRQWDTSAVLIALGLAPTDAYTIEDRFGRDAPFFAFLAVFFWVPLLWLVILRFALIPSAVMKLAGINGLGGRTIGLFAHALAFITVVPIVAFLLFSVVQALAYGGAYAVAYLGQALTGA